MVGGGVEKRGTVHKRERVVQVLGGGTVRLQRTSFIRFDHQ